MSTSHKYADNKLQPLLVLYPAVNHKTKESIYDKPVTVI